MEKLKVQNHTQIANIIIDQYLPKLSLTELKVIMAIARKTIGWHKISDRISCSQLVKMTGLSKNGIKSGIKGLIELKLINQQSTKYGYVYDINYQEGSTNDPQGSINDPLQGQLLTPQKKKETNKKEKDLQNKELLEYLNDKANRKFKIVHTSTINALKTYSIEDLKKIIDSKVKEWNDDSKMKKYLKQETLFRASHLDTYLTEAEEDESGSDISNW